MFIALQDFLKPDVDETELPPFFPTEIEGVLKAFSLASARQFNLFVCACADPVQLANISDAVRSRIVADIGAKCGPDLASLLDKILPNKVFSLTPVFFERAVFSIQSTLH